jgi:group I intron endonuclease
MGFIYLIENIINNKKYIGQTVVSVEKRFKQHCKKSSKKKSLITNSILKYGKENFKVTKLLETDELDLMEIHFIEQLKTLSPNGYNLKDGGASGSPSEETRQKMRLQKLGKKASEESKLKRLQTWKENGYSPIPPRITKESAKKGGLTRRVKPIIRTCLTTGEIKEYDSLTSIKEDGFCSTNVSFCCRYPNKRKSYLGFKWEYKDKKYVKNYESYKPRKTTGNKVSLINMKTNEQLDFKNQLAAAKYLNCSPGLFSNIKTGRSKTIKGYGVKYYA